ncbi:APC family permease [Thermococcus sp.]
MSSGGLKKEVTFFGLISFGMAGIIGTSWTYMNTRFYKLYGPGGVIFGFMIGTLMAALIALSYAELGAAIKREGGEVAFAYPTFGLKGSFAAAWMLFLGYITGAMSFYVIGLPLLLSWFFPQLNTIPIYSIAGTPVYLPSLLLGIAGALFFFYLNYRGVKLAQGFQMIMFLTLIGIGAIALVVALAKGSLSNMHPLFPSGKSPIESPLRFTLITIGYLTGFSMLTMIGEESAVTERKFGLAIVLSVTLAGLFYILEMFAGAIMMPVSQSINLSRGLIDEMATIAKPLGYIMWLAGFIGLVTSWNAAVLAGSRLVFSMSRMGLIPETFSKLHPKYGTPTNALILSTVVSICFGMLGLGALVWFLDITGVAIGVAWGISVISMILMRKKYPKLERPFRTPGGIFTGAAALALVTVVVLLPLIPGTSMSLEWPHEYGVLILWIVLGAILYYSSKKRWEELGRETIARNLLGEYYDKLYSKE